MSNIITDWRVATMACLQAAFPESEVVAGEKAGVNRRADALIRVWWPGWAAVPRDIALANPMLLIRYFPTRSKQPGDVPRDPSELEQASADIMAAFASKRKAGDLVANLACYVKSCVPNYADDQWHVEAQLQSITLNLAATSA